MDCVHTIEYGELIYPYWVCLHARIRLLLLTEQIKQNISHTWETFSVHFGDGLAVQPGIPAESET